jgi:ubiquinone/menaquinone biosynthesis C-methylase UbiE
MISVGTHNEEFRIKWIEQVLKQIPAGSRILDAGAGEQKFKHLCEHLKYVSQDFAQYDGKGDSKGLQMGKWDQSTLDIVSDITAIPEPDNSFDAIMCIEVFEHIPNPLDALKEFNRLLRREGQLIVTAPFCSLSHFAPYHYSSGFNRYFFEKHLPEYGFKIIEMQQNGNFFEYIAQEVRRLPNVAKQYANDGLTHIERCTIPFVLKMLDRFSKKDTGSKELLCFGYQVLAIKHTP